MNDMSNRPSISLGGGADPRGIQQLGGQPEGPTDPSPSPADSRPLLKPDMTEQEMDEAAEIFKQESGRGRPSPSITKWGRTIKGMLNRRVTVKSIYFDLVKGDPVFREEFSKGYRAFNAKYKREIDKD